MVHETEGVAWDVIETMAKDPKLPKAKALVKCAGLRGCDFAKCVKAALGAVPRSVKKACPELYPEVAAERVTPPRRR